MELREILSHKFTVLSEQKEKDGNSMNVLVPWTEANVKNQNGRTYPLALLQRETARVQGLIEKGAFIGAGDHPSSGIITISDTSHLVRKLWLDSGGRGWAELKILPTIKGKNIMEIIRGGGRLGISSRGFGTTNDKGVVQADYKLVGLDIVGAPSFKSATFSAEDIISESLAFEEKKEGKMKKNLDEELIKRVYQASEEKIPFALYKKRYGTVIQATALVEDGKYETMEQALRSLGESEARIQVLMKQLSPRRKCTLHEVAYEALACGVSPAVYAAKLNEQIERENTEEEGFPFTRQITANVLAEASRAGIDITDAEQRKQYLEIYYKQRQETETAEARQLEEEENLTDEAMAEREKAMKEKLKKDLAAQIVKEAMASGGADPEVVKRLVQEAWKKLDEKEK